MAQILVEDQVRALITAAENYRETVVAQKNRMRAAADACEAAMESDELSKKHVDALNESLEELDKCINDVDATIEELKRDLALAISVQER